MSEQLPAAGISPEIAVRDGLQMRLLVPEDAEAMFSILQADPDIQTRVTWTAGLQSAEDVRREIEEFVSNNGRRYAILEDGNIVGYAGGWKDTGYFGVVHEDEFGFGYFSHPAVRGKGIITDVMRAFMHDIQRTDSPKSFALYIADDNLASQAVAGKLGFKSTDEVYDEPTLLCKERRYVLNAENLA